MRHSHQPTKPQRYLLHSRNAKSEEVCDRHRWRRQPPHWSRMRMCHPSLQESNIDIPKMSKSEMAEKMHCHDMWTGDTILTRRNTEDNLLSKRAGTFCAGRTRNPPASDSQRSLGLQVHTSGPDGVLKTEPCREAALKSCPFRNPGFFFFFPCITTCSGEVLKDQIRRTLFFPRQYLFHFYLLVSSA